MRKLASAAVSMVLAVVAVLFIVTPASAATLYPCAPRDAVGYSGVCTRIANAPSSGVRVYDRTWGRVVTLSNGNSVHLRYWSIDTSGRCGVHGDSYVWSIYWSAGGGGHHAYIGDWYLATGTSAQWASYPDAWGGILNDQYEGKGSGTCDVYLPRR